MLYGVPALKKGEHIKNHLDKHFEMMKQNGFVPSTILIRINLKKDIKMESIQWELGALLLKLLNEFSEKV